MLLFFSLLMLTWSTSNSSDVRSVAELLRAHEFSLALQQAQALLQQTPNNPQLWTLQGMAHAGLQDRRAALLDYQHAVKLAPDYIPALKAEAQMEYEDGDKRGIATLRHILKLQPSDTVSHAMLAALAYQQHDCPTAVENYAASGTLLSTQPMALAQYGECLVEQKHAAESVPLFQQAVALEPDAWQMRYDLSLAEFAAGHTQSALEDLRPLLDSGTCNTQVCNLAATLYEAVGDTPHAVQILRQDIVEHSKDARLYVHFADLAFAHKSFQVGIDVLNAGLRQLPDSAELYVARGVLLVQLGKYKAAEDDFSKAEQLNPNQSFSSLAEGLAKLQENQLDQALRTTDLQIRRSPKDAFLYYLKAETLRAKGAAPGSAAFHEAVEAARAAVRLNSDYAAAEDLLGSFYLQEGKLDLARQQFESALKHNPLNQSALYHMITVSRKQGQTAAIPAYAKQLADAKAAEKKRDDLAGQFVLVEPAKQ